MNSIQNVMKIEMNTKYNCQRNLNTLLSKFVAMVCRLDRKPKLAEIVEKGIEN